MTKKIFLKINIIILFILILINVVSYEYLNENISLILSFKVTGAVRSNISKLTGLLFIPVLSFFTILVGLFQKQLIRLKHITYINLFFLLINIIIIISNQL